MKNKFLPLIAAAGLTMLVFSCSREFVTIEKITGSGTVETETRMVSNFTNVSAMGSTEVYITRGDEFKVEVKAYSNLLPYFETKLENGTLKLGYRGNFTISNDNSEVYITMPVLTGLQLSGSGNISASGNFPRSNSFEAVILGSGDILFSKGSTRQFNSSISGSGNIYAFGMIADNAETNTFGSGHTEITATDQLKVKITGSGNVYYKNNPVITANITGSGSVLPR